MSDPTEGRAFRLSLSARIMAAVSVLVLLIYGVALAVLGQPLRDGAQKHLDASAERELSAVSAAIQDHALLRDYPAIEQTLTARTEQMHILSVRYRARQTAFEARTAPSPLRYPRWFAQILDIQAPHVQSPLMIGGAEYGMVEVALDERPAIQEMWDLSVRFTLMAAGSLLGVLLVLRWLLQVNLRGVYALQTAARAIAGGDLTARAVLKQGAPPEVQETRRVFNAMADHVSQLVTDLEREHSRLQIEKERLKVTFKSIGDAVVVTDAQGRIEFMNPKAEELTRITNEEAMGRRVSEVLPLVNETSGVPVTNPLELALRHNRVVGLDSHTVIRRQDGANIAISDTAAPIMSSDGTLQGGVLVFQDESERRSLMQRLAWQAERDFLTGLWNRRTMEERLSAALQRVQAGMGHGIFCYIDLDRFKLVNDTCGHRAGDVLLQRLSALMAKRTEDGHCLARLGGDEFGLLFVDIDLPEALGHIQGLRDEVGRFRFEWEDKVFRLGVSLGVTELHGAMTDIGEILAQADTACYHAKTLGGNAIQVYEKAHPALQKINDEMQWVSAVTKAFEAHRFMLYRQQKVALSPNAVSDVHYEVLLRLRGEDGAIISPGEFLPAAERYGLAPSFDRWVIRNFFAYLDTHPEDEASYAINLSGRSLSDPGTADFILDEIDQYHFDSARISFEVTETAAIDSLDACERLILTLKSRGILFALDDFGKGQSSFGYLTRLPVAYLKIDGDFVRGMDHDREKMAIVKAMHTLGHELGKLTIAEQVETDAELSCLKAMGVDFVQGYLLHRPAPLPVD